MTSALKIFERVIILLLIGMMVVVILLTTLDLGWLILKDIVSPPVFLLSVEELLETFGFVLLILIGVELLETIKAYLSEHVIHVELVLEVALIAVARKIIILDIQKYQSLSLLAIAALVITLAVAYYLERSARRF